MTDIKTVTIHFTRQRYVTAFNTWYNTYGHQLFLEYYRATHKYSFFDGLIIIVFIHETHAQRFIDWFIEQGQWHYRLYAGEAIVTHFTYKEYSIEGIL